MKNIMYVFILFLKQQIKKKINRELAVANCLPTSTTCSKTNEDCSIKFVTFEGIS